LRDLSEFSFGGEAARTRPQHPDQSNDAEWAEYLFYRDNPKGQHFERWVHTFGCRQWFAVVRDTVTHEILEVCRIGERPSAPLPGAGKATR